MRPCPARFNRCTTVPARRVDAPDVKSCAVCGECFSLAAWLELPYRGAFTDLGSQPDLELRSCRCGNDLALAVLS